MSRQSLLSSSVIAPAVLGFALDRAGGAGRAVCWRKMGGKAIFGGYHDYQRNLRAVRARFLMV